MALERVTGTVEARAHKSVRRVSVPGRKRQRPDVRQGLLRKMAPESLKCVCVYCGSSQGVNESYSIAAQQLGSELAKRQMALVYGGGSVGLMGKVAAAASSYGALVTGIIPKSLEPEHISGTTPGQVIVTESMHERKTQMAARADAFIALPGGLGTLEELFEIATWRQLGYHQKPIGLLNTGGFFDPLLAFLDNTVAEGFVSFETRSYFIVETRVSNLLDKLQGQLRSSTS